MSCNCSELPDIIRLDDHPKVGRYDKLENGDWARLVRCPACGQLWWVDDWEKYQRQFAIKIPRQDGWREFDTIPLRRQYLLRSRGGLTAEKCIWAGCDGRRVKGVVYCLEHLYKTGTRE